MKREEFKKLLEENGIPYKKIIGKNNSFDLEVNKNVIINPDFLFGFPDYTLKCYDFFDKDVYNFEF